MITMIGVRSFLFFLVGAVFLSTPAGAVFAPPKPYGILPNEGQLAWHELEFYGFVHFSINTFTDREWGGGEELPSRFNPTDFSAEQIVRTAAEAGMKGLILTCKHHDGFCLWPSEFTEHSVKNSPYKAGKGDIVREISEACKKEGLKFGVYLSPWDRNHAEYARPEYIDYFRAQLRELLTGYGPVFEVWFDGANGGTGYYGGANESRNIDRATYYDWENTWAMVRELQPQAMLFTDLGPDVRWVGNEHGHAGDPCWATYTPHGLNGARPVPGQTLYKEGENGHRDGMYWIPAEVDVSIRPGWFYHASQDGKVRSPRNLVDLYYASVGRGASFLLNLPPDRRGRIHENDVEALRGFRAHLDATFAVNLAKAGKVSASNTRGNHVAYGVAQLFDGDRSTYWASDDGVCTPSIAVEFGGEQAFNVVDIRENLALGLRVDRWALDRWDNGAWVEFATGEGIGSRRLWQGDLQTTSKVRLRIVEAAACPALSEFGIYRAPDWAVEQVSVADKTSGKSDWKVLAVSSEIKGGGDAFRAIDSNPKTVWNTHPVTKELAPPQEICIDMGKKKLLKGFTYLPRQDHTPNGIVDQYEFYVSQDGKMWGSPVATGEFSNIKSNPIEQQILLDTPVKTRYFKFRALHVVHSRHITVAELGIVE